MRFHRRVLKQLDHRRYSRSVRRTEAIATINCCIHAHFAGAALAPLIDTLLALRLVQGTAPAQSASCRGRSSATCSRAGRLACNSPRSRSWSTARPLIAQHSRGDPCLRLIAPDLRHPDRSRRRVVTTSSRSSCSSRMRPRTPAGLRRCSRGTGGAPGPRVREDFRCWAACRRSFALR